jgi:UDP-N-acetylglucosamine 2-epimerase (non-hydrolysing)
MYYSKDHQSMRQIHLIAAARPNFMKIAPLYHALVKEDWCTVKLVHTGQHYDYMMSQAFFDDLKLPAPDYHLGIGSGTHAIQIGNTMMAYESLCIEKNKPDLIVVVGDVNATLACSVAAKKLHLKVAHLEAGLRSFDRSMPEEINRIVTDSICDFHWTPSEDADQNLINEGIKKHQISRVGNIMIDSYCMMKEKINKPRVWEGLQLHPQQYAILTLHRPINVDNPIGLTKVLQTIGEVSVPIVFPIHPRTRQQLQAIKSIPQNIKIIDPLGYLEFMSLLKESAYVITDSGGLQEETTYLNIPCFTIRDTTERPVTITMGTNQLVTINNLLEKLQNKKQGQIPPLWDGKTAERIVQLLRKSDAW